MIALEGVSCILGRHRVLQGITLSVGAGEVLAVLGPNGAGKTTLLRVMAGLIRPSGGRVLWLGRPADASGPAFRARLAFVGHKTHLYEAMTAWENLRFFGRLHGLRDAEQKAQALLAEEGLTLFAHEPVRTFSRGMQQRLAICRAWLTSPHLVLLDEPWTGLDAEASERLTRRIEGLRQAGGAAVVVGHDPRQLLRVADRYAILVGGRLVEEASALPWRGDEAGFAERYEKRWARLAVAAL